MMMTTTIQIWEAGDDDDYNDEENERTKFYTEQAVIFVFVFRPIIFGAGNCCQWWGLFSDEVKLLRYCNENDEGDGNHKNSFRS